MKVKNLLYGTLLYVGMVVALYGATEVWPVADYNVKLEREALAVKVSR